MEDFIVPESSKVPRHCVELMKSLPIASDFTFPCHSVNLIFYFSNKSDIGVINICCDII